MQKVQEFKSLLLSPSTQWIDVRAPIEFQEGSVPGALNLPLLNNQERHEIGIVYKAEGQEAAIRLGHQFVSGPVREERTQAWIAQVEKNPQSLIYCFRGGLRSQTVQAWLKEKGLDLPIVLGGYKALRQFFLATIEESCRKFSFRVVSGPTGSGKTRFLRESQAPFLDLEELACHRGSAFGAVARKQPSQSDFENSLAMAFLRMPESASEILVEDESRMIGKIVLPESLFLQMKQSARHFLQVPLEERVENIFQEYILESRLGIDADPGPFAEFKAAVGSISKKLGGQLTQEILFDLLMCEREFKVRKNLAPNKEWIRKLLEKYYDPSYARWQKAQNPKS